MANIISIQSKTFKSEDDSEAENFFMDIEPLFDKTKEINATITRFDDGAVELRLVLIPDEQI